MQCDRCGSDQVCKAGRDRAGRQQFRCRPCRHRFTERSISSFSGFHFPDEIIAVAVRWYMRLRLPYADVVVLLAERGDSVDRTTVFDWVQRFAPLYREVARRKRRPVGGWWSVDETYVKVAGVWRYVYRAVDEHGQVVDVVLSERRDTEADVSFFEHALAETEVRPVVVTTDKAACYPPALELGVAQGGAPHRQDGPATDRAGSWPPKESNPEYALVQDGSDSELVLSGARVHP